MSAQLQRLVIDFTREGLEIRTLYRRRNQDTPGPNSKARLREVEELSREGLRLALASLEGGAECVGTSGFTSRGYPQSPFSTLSRWEIALQVEKTIVPNKSPA